MTARVEPQDWWDLGFAAAVGAIALAGWGTTFTGPGWWVTGALGLGVGLAVALVVTVVGRGFDLLAAGVLVGYAVLCGPVVEGGPGGVLAVGDGLAATTDGWPLLVGTHPWIDATGPALLPVLQVCLLGSALTAGLALRTRAAAAPLAGAVPLLVAVLLLGRAEPVSVLVQGLGFGVVALGWLHQRSRLTHASVASGGGLQLGTTLPAVALVAVAGCVAALAAGGVGDAGERRVLRGLVPAYDVDGLRTPLDDFRTYTERAVPLPGNVHRRTLLTVRGAPPGARLRFATLDRYDGDRWLAANDTDATRDDDRFLRVSSRIDHPADGERLEVAVAPSAQWDGPWVATVGAVQSLTFLPGARDTAADDLRYNPATRAAVTAGAGLGPADLYVLTARVDDAEVTDAMTPSDDLDDDLYRRAAFLDPALEAWTSGADSRVAAVLQVAERLRTTGYYSDGAAAGEIGYPPGHSERRLGRDFVLADATVGNDEQYAAAMALMANRLRVPARVVVGAQVPDDGVVKGRHVSAWVELRAADGGWRVLDTAAFVPDRPPPSAASARGGSRPQRVSPESTPDERSREPERRRQRTQPERDRPDPAERPPDQESGADEAGGASADGADDGGSAWPAIALGLLGAGLLVGVVPGWKWLRRRRRLADRRISRRYAGAWAELVDHARDLGRPVPPGLTRPAEARALNRGSALATEADVRIFGPTEPRPTDAAAFWDVVRAELADLDAAVPRWRRLWARFSPASLRRR